MRSISVDFLAVGPKVKKNTFLIWRSVGHPVCRSDTISAILTKAL